MQTAGYDLLSVARLEDIIQAWQIAFIAVVGDFFLDRYLIIDPALTEPSLETGLDAYQVIEKRPQPGAAGTVTSNLLALNVADVTPVGISGDDGEGYELRTALEQQAVDMEQFLTVTGLMTPTYTKPLVREADGSLRELNRLDIRNREPIPRNLERAIIQRLEHVAATCDAVIISDQEDNPEWGVITPRVVAALAEIAGNDPNGLYWVDSRGDIACFRNCVIKPNAFEACRAAGIEYAGEPTLDQAQEAGERLLEQTDARAVVVTMGAEGVLVIAPEIEAVHVPGVRVEGPIDIVGAGDSFTAGMVATLAVRGTGWGEAAMVGNLVASITIQQLGTTGVATPEQLVQRLRDVHAGRVPGAS